MNIIHVFSVISGLIMGLGAYLSMRQYFKIKAYKAGKQMGNILIEYVQNGTRYMFGGDFIEYFPLTYFLRKLDDSEYNNYDDTLKRMYDQKAKYELLCWSGFILCFVFVFIETGGEITDAGY